MKNQLHVALLQAELAWEDPVANRGVFTQMIHGLERGSVDLIVLPEMFSTGFTMQPGRCAETMSGETVAWMKQMAAQMDCAVTGSLVIEQDARFFNRLLFVLPNRELHWYDKRHLFTLSGEDKAYTAGKERLIVNFRGFSICPLVCYDLRFPVFSRNTEAYDVLIYVANWPTARVSAWDALLKARAIENICYVIGVNRIGTDGNDTPYPGHSQALDYLGDTIVGLDAKQQITLAVLDRENLLHTRKKLAFLDDRDAFTVD